MSFIDGVVLINFLIMVGFLVAIPWAVRADRADAHLLHRQGCPDCEDLS